MFRQNMFGQAMFGQTIKERGYRSEENTRDEVNRERLPAAKEENECARQEREQVISADERGFDPR
jgi:hypothetical protein